MQIAEVIDLTMEIYHNYPGNPMLAPTRLDLTHNFAANGLRLERLETPTHAGTHIDAPSHMLENGANLDAIPLQKFIGWATVIDLRKKEAGTSIDKIDLAKEEGKIAGSDFVLLFTGWGEKLGYTRDYVFNSTWLCLDGAQWLIEKGISGVGIDHMSISGMEDEHDRLVHETLLGAGILIIEGLTITPRLLERDRWFLMALPLRLKGASGAPARVLALGVED